MNKYQRWIQNYNGRIYRKCKEVSEEMQKAFPELKIVKGMVTIIENLKEYQHQWLIDINNNIVDPTAKQWAGIVDYRPIDENDLEQIPTQRCHNCGGWCYGKRQTTCSPECDKEYADYLNKSIKEN